MGFWLGVLSWVYWVVCIELCVLSWVYWVRRTVWERCGRLLWLRPHEWLTRTTKKKIRDWWCSNRDEKQRSAWYRARALLQISTITLAYSCTESNYSMLIATTKRNKRVHKATACKRSRLPVMAANWKSLFYRKHSDRSRLSTSHFVSHNKMAVWQPMKLNIFFTFLRNYVNRTQPFLLDSYAFSY